LSLGQLFFDFPLMRQYVKVGSVTSQRLKVVSENQNFKFRLFIASKWSALSELASRAINTLVMILLARILAPEDFGIVTVAMVVISLSQTFREAGLSKILIQRQNYVEQTADIVFWTNLILSIIIYSTLLLFAAPIAQAVGGQHTAEVLRVQGLQIILAALCSTQIALFNRALDFRTLFWIRLVTTFFPGFASVPLALMGYGYWALVAGTLLSSLAQFLATWIISPWQPRWRYDLGLARGVIRPGLWITSESFLVWAYLSFDLIIVGIWLGPHDLGLYRTGSVLISLVFTLALSPFLPVMFSAFSRRQHELHWLVEAMIKANKAIAALALPIGIGAFLVREPLAFIVFGTRWTGTADVIGILGMVNALLWLNGANLEVYRAVGRLDLNIKIILVHIGVHLLVYLLTAPLGLIVFLWARLIVPILLYPFDLAVANRIFQIPFITMIWSMIGFIVATMVMAAIVLLTDAILPATTSHWLRLLMLIGAGATSYAAVILLIEGPFMMSILAPIAPRMAKMLTRQSA
jgi:O-antigen/teichoic acid export membrane protein